MPYSPACDTDEEDDKEEEKEEQAEKGGGGLGMIDIARKSGQKLNYHFTEIDETFSFFNLNIN